ncbi:MAG: 4-hydroxy-tetrahydrodipicolinate reductase [Verrucomicrobia bacterium RIFCSPHIGHO2_12_FULL_41_10]|nr:MAG: 4-hydroxy-tetrahydrodipicolinate reductase [Verrucomicrobia bacterium RIFCSPHIGHO2_12_FULL_41_10]
MKKVKVIIYGSNGKMGQSLLACLRDNLKMELVGAIASNDTIDSFLPLSDVVIDFTNIESTLPLVEKCLKAKKPLVIGTTGHSKEARSQIIAAAKEIPLVFSPNYSVGVNTLFWLTKKATEILGPEYDSEIIEIHHRFKKDAPSGTARRLAEIIAEVRHLDYEQDAHHGRVGMPGSRKETEIGVHAVRAGDVVGDHTVLLGTQGERLELIHRASSRETFARGALRAAFWACHQQPGLYDMQDVLGLKKN